MNLADVIRQASLNAPASMDGTAGPEPEPVHGAWANVVRLELFLTPEQANGLLASLIQSQQSLLTLTEASKFLRVRSATLARLAASGQIPAAQIDGSWRFQRHELEAWLASGAERAQEEPHVA
jgi:excisionase family DNA binding protein